MIGVLIRTAFGYCWASSLEEVVKEAALGSAPSFSSHRERPDELKDCISIIDARRDSRALFFLLLRRSRSFSVGGGRRALEKVISYASSSRPAGATACLVEKKDEVEVGGQLNGL